MRNDGSLRLSGIELVNIDIELDLVNKEEG